MSLDPQAKQFLNWYNSIDKLSFAEIGAEKARALYGQRPKDWAPAFVDMASVSNRVVQVKNLAIPIRIYTPIETDELLPVLVFYHGGGMVIGSLDGYDTLCRQLAAQSEFIIVSVDYRLAPEHKFPAAVDDAWASLAWIVDNADTFGGDKHNIAVGGDSAGGTLAAVVALQARQQLSVKLIAQLLIYPAVAPRPDSPSQIELGKGYFLERQTILWFHQCYQTSEKDCDDYRYGPLIATDHSGLPPTLVITAGYDPLKDEGIAYVEKLRKFGVEVQHQHYEGMFHPFLSLAGILDQGKEAIKRSAVFLQGNGD